MLAYFIRRAVDGWRWRLKAGNHRIIAHSGEAYHNKNDCLKAIELVQGSSTAKIYEEQ